MKKVSLKKQNDNDKMVKISSHVFFPQERKLFLREAVLTRIVNKAFLCGEVYICQDQILLTENNSEPETEVVQVFITGSGGSLTLGDI